MRVKFALIFILNLFLGLSFSHALTVGDLVSRSRQMIGDTPYYSAGAKLSDQRIIDFLNEGERYAAANGWFLTKRTSWVLVGGTTEYSLPTDFQTVKRLTIDGRIIPELTLDALDYNNGNWTSSSGSPNNYFIRTTSVSVIGFYSAPDVNSTGTVTMDYIAQPNNLSSMNDIPFLGLPELYPLHEALAKYVAYRYYLLIGNDKMADIYAKEVLSDIKRMKEIIETKPNYRPGFSGVR